MPILRDNRELPILFLHSSLDDAGLTAAEFRIYAHLCRRANGKGSACPGQPSIARVCRLEVKTVRKCLLRLNWLGLVRSIRRDGYATEVVLTSPEEWNLRRDERETFDADREESSQNGAPLPNGPGPESAAQNRGQAGEGGRGQTVGAPLPNGPDEGNPLKGKESPSSPPPTPAAPDLPSGDAAASASPPCEKLAGAGGRKKTKAAPSDFAIVSDPLALQAGAIFGKRATTPWNPAELRALARVQRAGGMKAADLELYARFYRKQRHADSGERPRFNLDTFLNNYFGEIDKAHRWATPKRVAPQPKPTASKTADGATVLSQPGEESPRVELPRHVAGTLSAGVRSLFQPTGAHVNGHAQKAA